MGFELTQICGKNGGISGISKESGHLIALLKAYFLGSQTLLGTCFQSPVYV